MVKDALREINGERVTVTAIVERFSNTRGYRKTNDPITTLLLVEVKDAAGRTLADHVWIEKVAPFVRFQLKRGDRVRFRATVEQYLKGYKGMIPGVSRTRTVDFQLVKARDVEKL